MRDRKEVDLDGRKRRKELGGVTMEETVILLSCVCVWGGGGGESIFNDKKK